MKKQPRYYQHEAYQALIKDIKRGEVPYATLCTGAGKSLLLAMLTNQALKQGGRVLQLCPTQELVTQNYNEAVGYCDKPNVIGICCAKLGRFEEHKQAVIASKDSFLRRRTSSGIFNLLLIDENHLVTPDSETGYRKIVRSLLRLNPSMKIVGATATPYRMDQGLLHEKCVKGEPLFTCESYKTDIPRLIEEGYLSHVESISGDVEVDLTGVALSGRDYNTDQMGVKFHEILPDAIADMRVKFEAFGIKTALVFASTVANAKEILRQWDGDDMMIVHGEMAQQERIHAINWIKNGSGRRIIVNVGVLTTGFDYTALDCVVLLRSTKSLGLYIQMVGRVIRAHEEKERGYVLDFGGNIEMHGPIDATIPPRNKKRRGEAPKKVCGLCNTINLLSAKYCKDCGAEFVSEGEEGGPYKMRSKAQILADKIAAETERYDIRSVLYMEAFSRKDGTNMIKMIFADDEYRQAHVHYLCLNHAGQARDISRRFVLSLFKDPKDFYELGKEGVTVENMLMLLNGAEAGQYFKTIRAIEIRPEGKYKRLTKVEFE